MSRRGFISFSSRNKNFPQGHQTSKTVHVFFHNVEITLKFLNSIHKEDTPQKQQNIFPFQILVHEHHTSLFFVSISVEFQQRYTSILTFRVICLSLGHNLKFFTTVLSVCLWCWIFTNQQSKLKILQKFKTKLYLNMEIT